MEVLVKEEMKVDFNGDDGGGVIREELLESARVEMGEVKQENERLKTILTRIMKDYESLRAQFVTIAQQKHQHQQDNQTKAPAADLGTGLDQEEHEAELLSLSLGTIKNTKNTNTDGKDGERKSVDDVGSGNLSLALQCSSKMGGSTSGDQSSDGVEKDEEEGGGEQWPPSKVLGKNPRNDERDLSPLVQVKKARVSVRARCDAPTMNDGCQWRKYGQKISKGNPCPRAYYRCTVAPGCPVRKQVQRCAEDMSILITTYEGTHNHPLPLAATTVASTTSAAASMLLSPSSASSAPPLTTTNLGFGLSTQSSKPSPPPNFHHLSATPSHPPTITLDLTSPSPQFNNASNTLSFSSYPSLSSGYFSKYTNQFHNNINNYNNYTNKINPGFPSYLPKNSGSQQEALTDTLAKAITLDPSFKSALAAAITSIVGGEGGGQTQAIPTGTATGSTSYHLNKPSPMLPLGKFGYPDQSSSLGFLNNSKSSPSMENRNPLN